MTNPFREPLPVDEALPRLREALVSGRSAVLVAPPGRGQDDAGAAGVAQRALGRGAENSGPRAAAACGTRSGGPDGLAPRRGRGRNGRLPGAIWLESLAQDPDRGGDRGGVHAARARRSGIEGDRRGPVRRVPRALARRGSRARARARCAWRAARGSAHSRHVGDARRRAGGETSRRCPGDREPGPRFRGRDALSRPRCARADRAADGGRDPAGRA